LGGRAGVALAWGLLVVPGGVRAGNDPLSVQMESVFKRSAPAVVKI
jgi:hypothetical protein